MFYHVKETQYTAKPEGPDPAYARKLQEILGGQFGEISVMMQYLFQGWNCRGPAKYKDMLLDIGTEEIGHVEMLSYMIAQLLENQPEAQAEAVESGSMAGEVLKGNQPRDVMMAAAFSPAHFITAGLGAMPVDSNGYPWVGKYIISSGNLLADFRSNLAAESQGRLQAVRMYELATDSSVRDMLHFMIARDTMHQNQWAAAIEDIIAEGLDGAPCPRASRWVRRCRRFPVSSGTTPQAPRAPKASGLRDHAPMVWASSPTWQSPNHSATSPNSGRSRRTSTGPESRPCRPRPARRSPSRAEVPDPRSDALANCSPRRRPEAAAPVDAR